MTPESKEIAAIVDRFQPEAREKLRDAVKRFALVLSVTEPVSAPPPRLRLVRGQGRNSDDMPTTPR